MADTPVCDGRITARKNEFSILQSLRRFGWLRTKDIALLVWRPRSKEPKHPPRLMQLEPRPSELRMAQRTLARLRTKRMVLHALAPDYSIIYTLAEGGVRELQGQGIESVSGKDLVRTFSAAHYHHRRLANSIAITGLIDGYKISAERETAQGHWFGGKNGIAGKIPDTIIRTNREIYWVEVERSRKNRPDYDRLVTWLCLVLRDFHTPGGSALLEKNMDWGKVFFVCTPSFKAKIIRDLMTAGWKQGHIEPLIEFSTSLYDIGSGNFQR